MNSNLIIDVKSENNSKTKDQFNNYKGDYFETQSQESQNFFCPKTGAHFRYRELCKKLEGIRMIRGEFQFEQLALAMCTQQKDTNDFSKTTDFANIQNLTIEQQESFQSILTADQRQALLMTQEIKCNIKPLDFNLTCNQTRPEEAVKNPFNGIIRDQQNFKDNTINRNHSTSQIFPIQVLEIQNQKSSFRKKTNLQTKQLSFQTRNFSFIDQSSSLGLNTKATGGQDLSSKVHLNRLSFQKSKFLSGSYSCLEKDTTTDSKQTNQTHQQEGLLQQMASAQSLLIQRKQSIELDYISHSLKKKQKSQKLKQNLQEIPEIKQKSALQSTCFSGMQKSGSQIKFRSIKQDLQFGHSPVAKISPLNLKKTQDKNTPQMMKSTNTLTPKMYFGNAKLPPIMKKSEAQSIQLLQVLKTAPKNFLKISPSHLSFRSSLSPLNKVHKTIKLQNTRTVVQNEKKAQNYAHKLIEKISKKTRVSDLKDVVS